MATPLSGLGPPGDNDAGDWPMGDDHPYAMWDGAYVLGSLSAGDRREFESHMAGCPACREAVVQLCGVPALLSQLSREDVAAIDEPGPGAELSATPPAVSPELLPSLLATVRWRRRRTRLTTWAVSAAAAVVLGIGVLVGVSGHSAPGQQTTVSAQPMSQVGTSLLTSTVSLSSYNWGTFINLKCVCLAPPGGFHDTLAMVVVGRDGSQTRLATWVAEPGHTATPAGSISIPVSQIAAVRVVSADDREILLERLL